LRVEVPDTDHLPVLVDRRLTRDDHEVAHAKAPARAGRARRDQGRDGSVARPSAVGA
jgi:hypothetical protein